MKLIIQITCFNEEVTLPETVLDLPRFVSGFDHVEYLVVDDGSADRTVEAARACGVHHVLRLPQHRGLGHAFRAGVMEALRLGADVIVHTDGDHQYRGADLPNLVQPLLDGRADVVIGDRRVHTIAHFSAAKRRLHRLGNWVVRLTSGTNVPDATSGFRAFSRHAALHINVLAGTTYTLETLIQAGRKSLTVVSVPIQTNPPTRPSRLIRTTGGYVLRQGLTIIRVFMAYAPLRFFGSLAAIPLGLGLLIGMRFLFLYMTGGGQGHVQSLILSSILLTLGFQLVALALLADLTAANRRILEDIQYQQRAQMYGAVDEQREPARTAP